MSVVIPRNTTIPTKMEKNYGTIGCDSLTSVLFSLYEGERARVMDNDWLGGFRFSPIPLAPKGVAHIKAHFEIDANGILNVSAVEQTSGVSYNITITNYKDSLSTEEIHRMVLDVEKYKVEDDEHRKKVRAKEALENYAYKMRNIVNDKEIGNKLDAAGKKKIKAAIKHMIDWLDGIQHAEADEFEDKLIRLELICVKLKRMRRESREEEENKKQKVRRREH